MSEKKQYENKYEEHLNKWAPERGFTEEERLEYDIVKGYCWRFETENDVDAQQRVYNLIKSILQNDNIDYISKLDKIKIIVDTNRSLMYFFKTRWNLCPSIGDKIFKD